MLASLYRAVRLSIGATLAVALCTAGLGCQGEGPKPPATAPAVDCSSPVRGSRYGVCGAVSTGAMSTGVEASVSGSLDATSGETAGRYSIVGGSFHADR